METKEIKITPPEGYEIDKENSTFEKIVFKKIGPKRFIDDKNYTGVAYFINYDSEVVRDENVHLNYRGNYNGFATRKMAEASIAMARISQIMMQDSRFGGFIIGEEWCDSNIKKYCIELTYCLDGTKSFNISCYSRTQRFPAFHTREQAQLFIKENLELLEQYFMV
jgi:hypothetical protein